MSILKFFLTAIPFVLLTAFTVTPKTGTSPGGDNAPDFTITTVDGDVISLQESVKDGKPTVIYFTASWCPTCAKNWPTLSEVYSEFKDQLNMVAVSIDPTDDAAVMKQLVKDRGVTFPVAAGNPQLMVKLGVKGQATTVGIDKNGDIAFTKKGVLSADDYRKLFHSLVAG